MLRRLTVRRHLRSCLPGLLGLAALVFAAYATAGPDAAVSREDRIKAALIFKLVKFVEWPTGAMPGKDPIQICVAGKSPVGDALSVVDGKPIRDRNTAYRRLAALSPAEVMGCHVLYVPESAREVGNGLPASLRLRGVLTVGDAPDFARRGGQIGLLRGENKVAIEVNLRVAREAGLEPGAPLLELATVVE